MRYAPLAVVMGLILWQAGVYPYKAKAQPLIHWKAAENYFSGEFRDHGFTMQCDADSGSCGVVWSPASTSNGTPLEVYGCDVESLMTRDELLARFIGRIASSHSLAVARDMAGVLDGFFQSGLRRACDAASRKARERIAVATTLPPFRLSNTTRGSTVNLVQGIDSSFSLLSTGLPQRPAYAGDVRARAGWAPRGNTNPVVIKLVGGSGGSSLIVLDGSDSSPCAPQWPGRGDEVHCGTVSVLPCDPRLDASCQQPALLLFGMRNGSVLVRVGGNRESRVFAAGFAPLSEDDLLVMGPDAPDLYVGGPVSDRSFVVRANAGGMVPVSRLRMVNGRWQRWTEAAIRQWLDPVLGYYENLAAGERISREQQVDLTLNLSLQVQMERELARWMATNAERQVVSHLQQHYGRAPHTLGPVDQEHDHRRPVPAAGITVMDAESGAVLAVASYPPAEALAFEDGVAVFAPGWQERLAGHGAPRWAIRQVLQSLQDRLQNDTNSNFATHPIGSTFKPVLLSLTIDQNSPLGTPDGMGRLFDLVVAGHTGVGGDRTAPLACQHATECARPASEAIAGLPIGPWGKEEGGHGGTWIGRWEFLIGSCNKFAVTLGLLSLLDWNAPPGNQVSCCWNAARDSFGFARTQNGRQVNPDSGSVIRTPLAMPPQSSAIQVINGAVAGTGELPDAPLFRRLQSDFGVSPRSQPDDFDSLPWLSCGGLSAMRIDRPVGTIATSQLYLSRFPVGVAFTNLFTGSGQNWWSNVKLAEAYARLATNRPINASFCEPTAASGVLFTDTQRHAELFSILTQQRTASWVHTPAINAWERSDPSQRTAISKTGTTLRHENNNSTGVFAIVAGSVYSRGVITGRPAGMRGGVAMVAHIDDIGMSTAATELVDSVFHLVAPQLEGGAR